MKTNDFGAFIYLTLIAWTSLSWSFSCANKTSKIKMYQSFLLKKDKTSRTIDEGIFIHLELAYRAVAVILNYTFKSGHYHMTAEKLESIVS